MSKTNETKFFFNLRRDVEGRVTQKAGEVRKQIHGYGTWTGDQVEHLEQEVNHFLESEASRVHSLLNPDVHQAEMKRETADANERLTRVKTEQEGIQQQASGHTSEIRFLKTQSTYDWNHDYLLLQVAGWSVAGVEGVNIFYGFLPLIPLVPVALLLAVCVVPAFKVWTQTAADTLKNAGDARRRLLFLMWALLGLGTFTALALARDSVMRDESLAPLPIYIGPIVSFAFYAVSICINWRYAPSDQDRKIRKDLKHAEQSSKQLEKQKSRLTLEEQKIKDTLHAQISIHQQYINEDKGYREYFESKGKEIIAMFKKDVGLLKPQANHVPHPVTLIALFLSVTVAFSSCHKMQEIKQVHVSVMEDKTDTTINNIHYEDLKISLEADSTAFASFTLRVVKISDQKIDTIREAKIEGWNSMSQQLYMPSRRRKERQAFFRRCDSLLSFPEKSVKQSSYILSPLSMELIRLSKESGDRSLYLVSDLGECSEYFNCYKEFKALDNPKKLADRFDQLFPLPNLQGIRIYILHTCKGGRAAIQQYGKLLTVFTIYLSRHNATIIPIANIN